MARRSKKTEHGSIISPISKRPLVDISGKALARLPKILVAVACGNNDAPLEFERTLDRALMGRGHLFEADRMNIIGHITDDARNTAVTKAQEQGFDYVFFADMDMTFPDGCIVQMLRSCTHIPNTELPVVAGVYNSRKNYSLHAYKWQPDTQDFRSINHEQDGFKLNSGLLPIDAAGTGCMFIDMGVFDALEWPWFEYRHNINTVTNKRERWSEDMVFCKKLYDANIHIYLNTDIVCGHIHHFQIKQTSDTEYSIVSV